MPHDPLSAERLDDLAGSRGSGSGSGRRVLELADPGDMGERFGGLGRGSQYRDFFGGGPCPMRTSSSRGKTLRDGDPVGS